VRNWNLTNSAFFSFYIWYFAYSFLPFPLFSTFPSFPTSQLPSPYNCHICAHKCLIPVLASVSQLTPRYCLLLWRREHLICGCPSLIAMIMARLCAWMDWACWLIHRTLMQPYTLLNVQTAIWSCGRDVRQLCATAELLLDISVVVDACHSNHLRHTCLCWSPSNTFPCRTLNRPGNGCSVTVQTSQHYGATYCLGLRGRILHKVAIRKFRQKGKYTDTRCHCALSVVTFNGKGRGNYWRSPRERQ